MNKLIGIFLALILVPTIHAQVKPDFVFTSPGTPSTAYGVILTDGNWGIGTTNPGNALEVIGNIETSSSYVLANPSFDRHQIGTDGTGFFIFNNTQSLYRMVIDDTTGNVGIGTTNPLEVLHVSGSANTSISLESTTNAQDLGIKFNDNSGVLAAELKWNEGARVLNWIPASAGANTAALSILSNSNVGIGTTNPVGKFEVVGSSPVVMISDNQLLNANSYLRVTEVENDFRGGFLKQDGGENTFVIGVHTAPGTDTADDIDAITINRLNGRVGINDPSPDGQLDIMSNQPPLGVVLVISSQNATSMLIMLGDGNLGIGTAAPDPQNGFDGLSIAGAAPAIALQDSGQDNLQIVTNANAFLFRNATDNISWLVVEENTPANTLYLDDTGAVGINKTNPTTALDVNGTVTATEFVGGGSGITGVVGISNSTSSLTLVEDSFTANTVFVTSVRFSTLTLTTGGGEAVVNFACPIGGTDGAMHQVAVLVDGDYVDGMSPTKGITSCGSANAGTASGTNCSFTYAFGGLAAEAHTFAMTFMSSSGTTDVNHDSNQVCQFRIKEY